MFLLLAIPLWCGFELARRVMREPSVVGAGVLGLGLAIARRVLAALNGEIYAENRPEGGLRVVLELPGELRKAE